MRNPQKRRPPAFQEYAADLLANAQYRMMSLDEKGLFHLLRNECWVNDRVPAKYHELSNYLGIECEKITECLTEKVLGFFITENNYLICPELNSYREQLNERREKLSSGGQAGGKKTQEKNRVQKASFKAMLKALSREEINKADININEKQSIEKNYLVVDQWVDEFEKSPSAYDLDPSFNRESKT